MINQVKFLVAIIFAALAMSACQTSSEEFANIEGVYTGDMARKEIHLCKVEHGRTTPVAVTQFGQDGRFGFKYAVEQPGIFVVNVVWKQTQRVVRWDHNLKRFYLNNGTNISLSMDAGNYQLLASNCKQNKVLSQWNNQVDTVFSYSHGFSYNIEGYETFFPLLPGYVEQANEFSKTINTGDASSDELMKLIVESDMNRAALSLIYTPRLKCPAREDYPDYYDYVLEERSPRSSRLMELAGGYEYLRNYSMFAVASTPGKMTNLERLKAFVESFNNDELKGYLGVENAKRFKQYDGEFLAYKKFITPYMVNEFQKDVFTKHEISIRNFDKGSPAFDFAGTDINGKEHRLSDYKGTVVYVDLWATWCGPCKAEIPALKVLEKKFHDQTVTFMSVSLDDNKSHDKWKKFVNDEQLTGVQLIVDKAFDSDLAMAYNVGAIPRFMLFDKEGNIFNINTVRPSDDKIEGIINELLK